MHVKIVLVDTSWLHNIWEMFWLFTTFKFLWENGVSGKIKAHWPQHPQHYNNCSAPTFLISFKTFSPPPPFKKEGRDYVYFMREYKVETIKLLPFLMTDFLFTELQRHNIWRKLKNHMKNDMPNNIFPSYLNISDPNLTWYQIHRIIITFHHMISLALWD